MNDPTRRTEVTIHVTEEDIRSASRGTVDLCPIAKAIKRELGMTHNVVVYGRTAEVNDRRTSLPLSASTFVHDFDSGYPVHPFTFKIGI